MKLRAVLLALALTTIPAQATSGGVCAFPGGVPIMAWSPDGSHLAAVLIAGLCPGATVAVTDGQTFTALDASSNASVTTLQWSPDGRRLAAGWGYGRTTIDVYDVTSGAKTQIAQGVDPAWAPDGRAIAYVHLGGGLHLIAPDGTGDHRIASGDSPAWSPDSGRIAYHRAGSIFVARSDGSAEERLAAGEKALWAPDGTAMAIVRDRGAYLHPLDGTGERRIGRGRLLQWSPSGDAVAMLDFDGVVRLVTVRTGRKQRIAEDVEAAAVRPQWDRLATLIRVFEAPEIYLAEATGAAPKRITPPPCGPALPHCYAGSDGNDRIVGTAGRDVVLPGAGDDRVWARGGNDRIDAAFGRDFVAAGAGHDMVVTHGNDDRLDGGPGRDYLYPGNGEDVVDGGPGRDFISASGDGRIDRIRCGSGTDFVYADRVDRVAADCERVKR
jgi:hypothetical protein